MALTEITRTVKDSTLTFIQAFDNLAGVVEGFHKASLSQIDIDALADIDLNATGADLKAKINSGYVLKTNGRPASEVYGKLIVNVDQYADARLRKYYKDNVAAQFVDNAATLADHEARLTAGTL